MASLDDIRKALGNNPPSPTPSAPAPITDLSPDKMSFIETLKAEKAAKEQAAREALPATRKSIEDSGYLYHYAPREARDSIVSGGFDVSKARTAVGDVVGEASEFATHVPENSMYFYTRPEDAPSSGTIFGTGETGQRPDLYRTKIEPGMLDDMVVDPRLPLRGGVGSAVILPSKTGKFQAELIGQNAEFGIRGDNISPATYDPIKPLSTNPIDNLRFDVDGKSYFIHYSPNKIEVGDVIRASGSVQNDTGDALRGFSYGYDALNKGVVSSAVNMGHSVLTGQGSDQLNMYITSADASNVFPDLNTAQGLDGTSERAIRRRSKSN
jgi:hypothetical protein